MDFPFKTANNIALWHKRIFESCNDVKCFDAIDGGVCALNSIVLNGVILSKIKALCSTKHQSIDSFWSSMWKCTCGFAPNQSVAALFTIHDYWWLFWWNLSQDYCEWSTFIAAHAVGRQIEKWCKVGLPFLFSKGFSVFTLMLQDLKQKLSETLSGNYSNFIIYIYFVLVVKFKILHWFLF